MKKWDKTVNNVNNIDSSRGMKERLGMKDFIIIVR